jgi:hypothetical protein
VSAVEKAEKGALRLAGSPITFRETTLEPLRFTLQPRVGGYADGVRDAEKLSIHRAVAWRNQRQRA